MIDETAPGIYTDGSSKPKPRRGGIGIRYVFIDASGHEVFEDLSMPGYRGATNNEMELKACILGLQNAAPYLTRGQFQRIDIYTDSNYVITNVPNALFVWPTFKWLKKGGGPVLNAELWKEFVRWRVKLRMPVYAKKVEAHSTDIHNRQVDRLAKESAEYSINKPLSPRIVRRKLSKAKTRIGSVIMKGQRVRVRIIQGSTSLCRDCTGTDTK